LEHLILEKKYGKFGQGRKSKNGQAIKSSKVNETKYKFTQYFSRRQFAEWIKLIYSQEKLFCETNYEEQHDKHARERGEIIVARASNYGCDGNADFIANAKALDLQDIMKSDLRCKVHDPSERCQCEYSYTPELLAVWKVMGLPCSKSTIGHLHATSSISLREDNDTCIQSLQAIIAELQIFNGLVKPKNMRIAFTDGEYGECSELQRKKNVR
jgi:hypothetical protein